MIETENNNYNASYFKYQNRKKKNFKIRKLETKAVQVITY